jgi:hypothetical protein
MRTAVRPLAVLAALCLAVAVPAVAKPPHPSHPAQPSHPAEPNHPDAGKSHKCMVHDDAYTASGTLANFSATLSGKNRYTGTITVNVTHTNEHGEADLNKTVTYMLTDAVVKFRKGTGPTTTGARVTVVGSITELGKKCDQTGFTPTTTVRKVDVRPVRHHK